MVVCSLFSRLSDSIEARDQHAGAASLRPGVRHPPLLARKSCTLPRTYSPDLAHPSAGRGCMGDGVRARRAPEMARDRGPGEHVCGMALPEAVLGRVWSDFHVVCSARTPVSAGELNIGVSGRSGEDVGRANARDVQMFIRCSGEKSCRSHLYYGHTHVYISV